MLRTEKRHKTAHCLAFPHYTTAPPEAKWEGQSLGTNDLVLLTSPARSTIVTSC